MFEPRARVTDPCATTYKRQISRVPRRNAFRSTRLRILFALALPQHKHCAKLVHVSPRGNPRDKAFRLVLHENEHEALMTMALAEDMSAAAWIRSRIRKAWAEHVARDLPSGKPRRGKRKR